MRVVEWRDFILVEDHVVGDDKDLVVLVDDAEAGDTILERAVWV